MKDVVCSGSRGDQCAVWIENQFLCVLASRQAGSSLCTGRCDFNNLLLSPGRLELFTLSLVGVFGVSSESQPHLIRTSHICFPEHGAASWRTQELPERQNCSLRGAEE